MLETVKTVEDSIQEVQRQKGKEERKNKSHRKKEKEYVTYHWKL